LECGPDGGDEKYLERGAEQEKYRGKEKEAESVEEVAGMTKALRQ
jgi:hypothetical protein